jgi:hypothetical protein
LIVHVDLREGPAADVAFERLVVLELHLRRELLGGLLVELGERDLLIRDDLHLHPAIDAPLHAVGDESLDLVLIVLVDRLAGLHVGGRAAGGCKREGEGEGQDCGDTNRRELQHRTTPFEPAATAIREQSSSRPSLESRLVRRRPWSGRRRACV